MGSKELLHFRGELISWGHLTGRLESEHAVDESDQACSKHHLIVWRRRRQPPPHPPHRSRDEGGTGRIRRPRKARARTQQTVIDIDPSCWYPRSYCDRLGFVERLCGCQLVEGDENAMRAQLTSHRGPGRPILGMAGGPRLSRCAQVPTGELVPGHEHVVDEEHVRAAPSAHPRTRGRPERGWGRRGRRWSGHVINPTGASVEVWGGH